MKTYIFTDEANTWRAEYRVDGMQNSLTQKIMSIKSFGVNRVWNYTELVPELVALGLPNTVGGDFSEVVMNAFAETKKLRMLKMYESEYDVWLRVSTAKDFLAFSFEEETEPATIDTEEGTIDIEVAALTDVTALKAVFRTSYGSFVTQGGNDQVSGVTEIDYTSPVTFVVHSETPLDMKEYVVTVTVAS